jgi:hypothetical protein
VQAPEPQQQAKAAEPAVTTQPATTEAKLEPAVTAQPSAATAAKVEPAATTQLVQQAASNSCNVQACGAAYQSFRASDCTYQPRGGERRLCSMTGGAVTARTAKPDKSELTSRRSSAPDDLREVERVVKRQPLDLQPAASRSSATSGRGEMREVERIVRHMTRDEAADIPVEDGYGRVFIVRKAYR